MKNAIALLTKTSLIATTVLLFTCCQFSGIRGSGNITTENRPITAAFESIAAERGLEVTVAQSDTPSILVETDDNVQKHITTNIENGVLHLTCDQSSFNNVTIKIVVHLPKITGLEVSGGANLNSKNTLKSNNITIKASSGAEASVSIEAEKASCESSSGSTITMRGKAIELETASSSGSTIDARGLLSNNIIASAASGSSTEINPLVSLKAKASSGGNISYINTPKNLSKKSSSGGSINKE